MPRAVNGAVVALMALALMLVGTSPAIAAERPFGDMVEYELVFPVDGPNGYVDGFWDARSHGTHASQDIMADKGIPVVAAATGTVRLVNWSRDPGLNPMRCCSVVIDHADGWRSAYLHLTNDTPGTDDGQGWGIAPGIVPGARVQAGQLLGWVGDSQAAETTPPHLHFELYDPAGVKVNSYAALLAAEARRYETPESGSGAGDSVQGESIDDLAAAALVRRGDRGDGVSELQESLVELGYDVGPVDGIFGGLTETAVILLQVDFRLDADGLVGTITKGAISGLLRPDGAILGFGRSSDEVADLQSALNEAGVDAGSADGVFGPKTLQAVILFQKGSELTVDGLVGPQTWGALEMR